MKTRAQILAKLEELPDHNCTTPEEALRWVLEPAHSVGSVLTYRSGEYSAGSRLEGADGRVRSACFVRRANSGYRLRAFVVTKMSGGDALVETVFFQRFKSRRPYYPYDGETFEFIGDHNED